MVGETLRWKEAEEVEVTEMEAKRAGTRKPGKRCPLVFLFLDGTVLMSE
jgi:hypothetical protein